MKRILLPLAVSAAAVQNNAPSRIRNTLTRSGGPLKNSNASAPLKASPSPSETQASHTARALKSPTVDISQFPIGSDRFIGSNGQVTTSKPSGSHVKVNVGENNAYVGSIGNASDKLPQIDARGLENKVITGSYNKEGIEAPSVNITVGNGQHINPNRTPMNIEAKGAIHIDDYTVYGNTKIDFKAVENPIVGVDKDQITVKNGNTTLADFAVNNSIKDVQAFADNNILFDGQPLSNQPGVDISQFPIGSDRFIGSNGQVTTSKPSGSHVKVNVGENNAYVGSIGNASDKLPQIDARGLENKVITGSYNKEGIEAPSVNITVGNGQHINPNRTPMNIEAKGAIHIDDYTVYGNTKIDFKAVENPIVGVDKDQITVKNGNTTLADFAVNNSIKDVQAFADNNILFDGQPLSNQPLSNQPLSNQPLSNQPLSNQPLSNQPGPESSGSSLGQKAGAAVFAAALAAVALN